MRTVKITRCIPHMYFYKLLKIIKYTMLHTKCTMLHTKCTVLHTKCTVLHTKCTMLHTQLNISHYTNVAWTLVLFFAHPTSDNAMMSCNIIARYKILTYHLWASFFCVRLNLQFPIPRCQVHRKLLLLIPKLKIYCRHMVIRQSMILGRMFVSYMSTLITACPLKCTRLLAHRWEVTSFD